MAISVTDLGTIEDTGNDAQSNFSFGSFGTETSDRLLVALISGRDNATNFSLTSVTIGGVAASFVSTDGTSRQQIAVIAYALVPTGASGTVVADWSESLTNDQLCTLLRVTGSQTTPYDTDTNSVAADPITCTIDCPAAGIVIGSHVLGGSTGPNVTWTGLANEVADQEATDTFSTHSAAYEIFASAQTGLSVSVDRSTDTAHVLAVASFAAVSGYTLAQDGGSFTLTGGTNTLTAQRKLVTSGGSFALTGGDATLRRGFAMVAAGGSYSLTGGSAGLLVARKLTADGGAYTLTGGAAGLLAGRKLAADGGDFTLTGGQASLLAQRVLDAGGAVYSLDGGDATLLVGRKLAALGGSFELVGGDVEFTYDSSGPAEPEVIWGYRRRKRVKAQPPGKVVYQGVSQEWDDDEAVILLLH